MSIVSAQILGSRDTDDIAKSHLREALVAEQPDEKNYHIRQALQALELDG